MSESTTTEKPWQWWWGEGAPAEHYQGPFGSRQEAIEAATDAEPECRTITVTEAYQMALRDDFLTADRVIEQFNDWNEDAADPEGDQCIERTTPEQERELETALREAWIAWRTKHGLGTSWAFAETRNGEVIELEAISDE